MQKLITLGAENKSLTFERKNGFTSLKLTSATVIGQVEPTEKPYIRMKLKGNVYGLELYSHWIPETQHFNCFDLLLTASNVAALAYAKFHTLTCYWPEGSKLEGVDLTFEMS